MRTFAWCSLAFLAGCACASESGIEAARAAVRAGRLAEAEHLLQTAIATSPQSPDLQLELGRVMMLEQQFEPAVEALGKAVQLNPDSLECNMALAEALLQWRHFPVAIQFLEAIEGKFAGTPEFQYNLGLAHFSVRHPDIALPHFLEAVRLRPDFDKAQFFVAACHATKGSVSEAIKEYRALVKRRPDNPAYWLALAQVLDSEGQENRKEAVAACQRALALRPSDAGAQFELAALLTKSGELKSARPLLERLVAAQPNVLPAHVLLSKVYFRLGLKELAQRENAIVRELQARGTPAQ